MISDGIADENSDEWLQICWRGGTALTSTP